MRVVSWPFIGVLGHTMISLITPASQGINAYGMLACYWCFRECVDVLRDALHEWDLLGDQSMGYASVLLEGMCLYAGPLKSTKFICHSGMLAFHW